MWTWRRRAAGMRRYVRFSVGTYDPATARVYTDLGLFTAHPDFGEDTTALFNLLTGYAGGYKWKKLLVAPLDLRDQIVALIERERRHAQAGRPARIIVKMNALVEPSVIDALYGASQAGVTIELVIRGICCLRPGLPGVSENIRVISIVDKFLRRSRRAGAPGGAHPRFRLIRASHAPPGRPTRHRRRPGSVCAVAQGRRRPAPDARRAAQDGARRRGPEAARPGARAPGRQPVQAGARDRRDHRPRVRRSARRARGGARARRGDRPRHRLAHRAGRPQHGRDRGARAGLEPAGVRAARGLERAVPRAPQGRRLPARIPRRDRQRGGDARLVPRSQAPPPPRRR